MIERFEMELDKTVRADRLTASGLVIAKACFVFSAHGFGNAAATNQFDIYDGSDSSGRHIFSLSGIQWFDDHISFDPPLFFAHGIYVDFATNGTAITIQYREVEP